MLLRFVAKNIYSFKEETEFNLFPNKSQRLQHHKKQVNGIDFLRFTAIYGANGAGKSNLIKAISLLESIVRDGKLRPNLEQIKFKLDPECLNTPTSLGIEFFAAGKIYYYTLTFQDNIILNENLVESKRDKDVLIFDRNNETSQKIDFPQDYQIEEKNKLFIEVLEEKLLQKNELLLSFLSSKYPIDFPDAKHAFDWFNETLVIIKPDAKPGGIAHTLDTHSEIKDFANNFIPSLNTGISEIYVEKERFEELVGKSEVKNVKRIIDELKNNPDKISVLVHAETGDEISLVYENEEIIAKKLITKHKNNKGALVDFSFRDESDGTRRLIEYVLAFSDVVYDQKVYLIDEIERSIHPITIKEILSTLSLDEDAQGQLIFTTHESNLLDQSILRPDEIWFAQKDIDGSTRLYSLSLYQVHNTVKIENGYLEGRYGGIPFLSHSHELNWHKYGELPK